MNKIFNKYIITLLIFYTFWLFGVPYIFKKAAPVVCRNISVNTDYTVEITKPELRLNILPAAKITAENITVTEKKSSDITSVENFELKFRLLPLLSGHIHINRVSAAKLVIKSTLKDKIELDKDFLCNLKNARIRCDSAKLDAFEIVLNQKGINNPVIYSGKDIYFRKNHRYIKLKADTQINLQNRISTAKTELFLPRNNDVKKSVINMEIKNFDIAPLGEFLKQYLPEDLVSLNGIINIKIDKYNLGAVLKNCSVIMKDSAKSIIFPETLNVNSKFRLTSKKISFENIDVLSKNINMTVNGSVSNYMDKSLTALDLNFRLNKSRVEDIVNILPPIVVEEFNVYKLKHYKFYGDSIGNFSIKGDVKEPDVTGDIFIDNGVLIAPIKNARGATIKLSFTGRYINFDVFVPAGGEEKVWVKGGVELYNVKYSDMRIWSTKSVDLQTAEEKVLPLHEILNFIIGPVPIMDIKGRGNIDITVKGNRKDPHVWGVLNANNVTTFFNEIPNLVLNNAEAVLTFDDENAVFKTVKGRVNNKDIDINGTCNLAGKFDFKVSSKGQELGYLHRAILTSAGMIDDIKKMIPAADKTSGLINLDLKVFGAVKDIEDLKFNTNFFTSGTIELLGNTFEMQGFGIKNTRGIINFDGVNADADITSFAGNSQITAKAHVKDSIADIDVKIPHLNLNDIIPPKSNFPEELGNIFLDVSAKYKGLIDKIEYDKINFDAHILGTSPDNKLKVSNGEISLKNNKFSITNLKGSVIDTGNLFDINLNAENIAQKPNISGNINLRGFELSNLQTLAAYSIIPEKIRTYVKSVKFTRGKINLNCRINRNKMNFYTDLGGISFVYSPAEIPVKIVNGSLIMRNNHLKLNKINLLADDMPVLADGSVEDIFAGRKFDMYFNSKPRQDFIDKYINKNQIYPIKIKGDIVYSAKLKGNKDNFDVKSDVEMAKDSSIYYLGATVGDVENAIVLNLDTKILKQNKLRIKEFSYDKIIASQGSRTTRLNMLKARGGIDVYSNDLVFHDLFIKTQNPTDARIFNIIFRKPNIKQGQFTSNLKFNGRLSNPVLLGSFHIFETNIPFLDTTMKNITFNFRERTIDLYSKGEILGNDISVKAILRNKLTPPYYVEKAELNTQMLDLNYIIDKLKLSQVDNDKTFESFENFDLTSLIIKNIVMKADSIHLRNISAESFEAAASLNEHKVMNVDNFKFYVAKGFLDGSFMYNLKDNGTKLKLKVSDIDANMLSAALFDLNNQIYGGLTGDISLSCNGSDFDNCMKTLNGEGRFNVADGRMPKLGSLEYLLKAGNLLKGGITGVSINSVIDIITPLKTGNFSNIYGTIGIKDGIADDIEIATRGKDLSLFIGGTYNFSTSVAEMEVLGLLSKKISTMFGAVGNVSLNTLFNVIPGVDLSKDSAILAKINKIPGIELSSKAYRKFIAEIKGNINGDNYVTSFRWIN